MKDDILTVMWKERKAMFRTQGRRGQTIMTLLSPLFLAIFFPWQMGADWVETSMSLVLAVVVTFILVGITVPDSFAGERERHTLPTLLASRLPDRAILWGKVGGSVFLGWVATLVVLLISVVSLNLTHWQGRVLFFKPSLLVADMLVSFLVALVTAGLGVLFSMRSETVQQAQQATMSVLLLPAMFLQFGLLVVLENDSAKAFLRRTVGALSFTQLIASIVTVLVLICGALFALAMARFKRARLILG
jgi:ABC-2 type transport system permease protein